MSLFYFNNKQESNTFWEHLEELRWLILRMLVVLGLLFSVVFSFRDFIFNKIIFPPLSSNFVVYRSLCKLADWLHNPDFCPGDFRINLINLELTGQFMAHISTAATIAAVIAVPYLLYELWRFVAPALYPHERKNVGWVFVTSSFLFYLGAVVSYYLIFPLTIRFLGTYQVSGLVPNQISLDSYLSTLFILVFAMGLMFEMPVLAYFLSRLGILNARMLKSVRSYALIILLILSAIITPTTDPFTMLAVALPLYLLYELSIVVCKK
ncbi:MAG: twin-arginine translocase subunit TatC [Paludibacter sp.]|nr:twin-arginine translocase subunit TatC [Paludibacter sp.]